MKTKLISALCVLVALCSLLVGTVYAWISIGETTAPMVFKIAKIDSTISLYEIRDSNRNGVPDYGWSEGEDHAVVPIHPLYTEIGTQAALEAEYAEINMSMTMTNILPTQIIMYNVYILNRSEADNVIRITFTGYDQSNYLDENSEPLYTGTDFDAFINCLKIMSVTVGQVSADNTTVTYGDKTYFADAVFGTDENNANNRTLNFTVISGINIENNLLSTNQNEVNLILKFEFETLANLNKASADGGAGLSLTEAQYQAYQGSTFKLPLMSVYMEILD